MLPYIPYYKMHSIVFYVPEAHVMYLTVFSSFLISFVMGWGEAARAGWLSSFIHLLLHPPQYGPWNLPCGLLVHKSTYAPMIYTALCIMFWMRAYPLHGQVGGGWAQEISSFFWPQMALAYCLDAISQGPKPLIFQGPNFSHFPL